MKRTMENQNEGMKNQKGEMMKERTKNQKKE